MPSNQIAENFFNVEFLNQGLQILGGPNYSSNKFLREAKESVETLVYDHSENSISDSSGYILEDVSEIKETFAKSLTECDRILYPRMKPAEGNKNTKEIISKSCDAEGHFIAESLTFSDAHFVNDSRALPNLARTLVILGSSLIAGLNISDLPCHINRIIIVENKPRDLALGLALLSLEEVVKQAKERQIEIQFFLDDNVELLIQRFQDNVLGFKPTSAYGLQISMSPVPNPPLLAFYSWLKNEEGFCLNISGFLGGEVDELNQVIQTAAISKLYPSRKLLKYKQQPKDGSTVIVASGPSLDESIQWLQEHQNNLTIVAAGSSLGTLLKNNITPKACVFLERQSIVFENDLMSLVEDGFSLDNIILFGSVTLDPRVLSLFSEKYLFHRPLSTSLALFAEESPSKLFQAGPHSVNAALEVLLHIGLKNFLLLGCDFSASDKEYPRSKFALGDSPRNLNIPVSGRAKTTVFSNPGLIDSSKYFSNACNYFNARIFSPPYGVKLPLKNFDLVTLDDFSPDDLGQPADLTFVDEDFVLPLPLSTLKSRLNDAQSYLNNELESLTHTIKTESCWSKKLVSAIDQNLKLDESNLQPHEVMIKRLIHYPMFLALSTLHDAPDSDWEQCRSLALDNLSHLNSLYMSILSLLQNIVSDPNVLNDNFSWQEIKNQI